MPKGMSYRRGGAFRTGGTVVTGGLVDRRALRADAAMEGLRERARVRREKVEAMRRSMAKDKNMAVSGGKGVGATGGNLAAKMKKLHSNLTTSAKRAGQHLAGLSANSLYHDLHRMTQYEWGAVREALRQAMGHKPHPAWFPMAPGPMEADAEHYKRAADMPSASAAADALHTSGAGFLDAIKHGFKTAIAKAKELVSHGKKFAGIADDVLTFGQLLPVVGKYSKQARDNVRHVRAGLEVADSALNAKTAQDAVNVLAPHIAGMSIRNNNARDRRHLRNNSRGAYSRHSNVNLNVGSSVNHDEVVPSKPPENQRDANPKRDSVTHGVHVAGGFHTGGAMSLAQHPRHLAVG